MIAPWGFVEHPLELVLLTRKSQHEQRAKHWRNGSSTAFNRRFNTAIEFSILPVFFSFLFYSLL